MMNFLNLVLAANLGRLKGFGAYEPEEGKEGGPLGTVITKFFSNLFAFLTIVAGLMFAVYFILGALNWITSSGQPEKVQKAQNKMISAAIGLIAVIAAYGIAVIASKVLGLEILNPAKYIEDFWK